MQRVGQPGVTQHSQDHRRGISRQPHTPGDLSAPSHGAETADAGNTRHNSSNSAALSPAGEMSTKLWKADLAVNLQTPLSFSALEMLLTHKQHYHHHHHQWRQLRLTVCQSLCKVLYVILFHSHNRPIRRSSSSYEWGSWSSGRCWSCPRRTH